MSLSFDSYIDSLFIDAKRRIDEFIEINIINAKTRLLNIGVKEISKGTNQNLIEKYLKRRGYVENYVLGRLVFTKGFTVVCVHDDFIEVWHDKTNNNKSVFIHESELTGLPITLNYMERI